MKTLKIKIAKLFIALTLSSMISSTVTACKSSAAELDKEYKPTLDNNKSKTKIQLAVLLDTSSSMDGLIDQAKARLWTIVNTLTTLRFADQMPQIEIAVYEYGNSSLSSADGYIRQVTGFTTDLDMVSEVLFGLRTGGGLELCGEAIQTSLRKLQWDDDKNAMKLLFIAGNEPFDQVGDNRVNYISAIGQAVKNDIYINTIHCGDYKSGINGHWKKAAEYGLGKYFNIDHNKRIQYIATPYDNELEVMNTKLNNTYYGYGKQGTVYKSKQVEQDRNAQSMDKAVYAERSVSKAKANYSNANWDMVDAYRNDKEFAKKVDKQTLPNEFKGLTDIELEEKIKAIEKERVSIQKEIDKLAKSRQAYIAQQQSNEKDIDDLGTAITNSILEFAKRKNYTYQP